MGGGIAGLAAAFFLRDAGRGGDRAGGLATARRQARGLRGRRDRRRRGRRGPARPPPRGHSTSIGAVGLAGQLALPRHAAADLDPAAAAAAAAAAVHGRARRPGRAGQLGDPLRSPGWPAPATISSCRRPRGTVTCPWPASRGEVRPGTRGPAGRSAARRRLRGPVRQLSFEATLPGLAAGLAAARLPDRGGGIAVLPAPDAPRPAAPVFTTPVGRPGHAAARDRRRVRRHGADQRDDPGARPGAADRRDGAGRTGRWAGTGGWRLTIGSDPGAGTARRRRGHPRRCPPGRPGRLLAGVPGPSAAAAALGEIEHREHGDRHAGLPATPRSRHRRTGSGYLVPAVDGRAVKAVTFSTVKWPHLRAGGAARAHCAVLRGPAGRGSPAAARRRRAGPAGRR